MLTREGQMRTAIVLAALFFASSYSVAFADSVNGTILAYDRKAKIIVLNDNTVWTLGESEKAVPDGLKAGDRVTIEFESLGEDGTGTIETITLAE